MAEETSEPNFSHEQWSEMKARYNKAKDLLQNVADLHVKFETAQVNLKSTQTEIEKISIDVRERLTTIENAKNDSTNFVTEIKGHLEKVQSGIVLLNDSLTKFEGIKGKIEGKDGEIENLVSSANSLKTDIDKIKVDAQKSLDAISDLFTQVQGKITEMDKAYTGFVEIRAKISDEKTGLEAVLNQAQILNTQSKQVFDEITDYRDKSKIYLKEIEANRDASNLTSVEMEESLSRSKEKLTEIEKIAGIIADTGLANAFQKRERMLRWSSGTWLVIIVLAVGGLATFLYFLFKEYFSAETPTIPELPVLLLRITLTSPLLYLIGIATHNYNKERDLNEKYAFKATIAEVMRSHSDFLVETAEKTSEENSVFIRNTIRSIYTEPFESNLNMKKVNKELKNILDKEKDNKFKITDTVNKVKELKDLVPDEELLKKVIDILAKFK